MTRIGTLIIWFVAAFYAYGAFVHVANILGWNGFDWVTAPLKWQVLDIVYLVLDLLVAIGLILSWRIGYVAFFVAALSQVVLYTVLRNWIIDVPEAFARSPEEVQYLDSLVIFHVVTLCLVLLATWLRKSGSAASQR